MTLQAPFIYFGGKGRIAAEVWARLGDTPNYVEPFAGSAAVLLARPDSHEWWDRIETLNDADGYISNFWRSVQAEPDAVAHWADWPVNECDLHARHAWLLGQQERMVSQLEGDPDWFDAKVAGWWLWGICSWIAGGWCAGNGPWHVVDGKLVSTRADGAGAWRKRPHLGDAGRGINRQRPHLGDGQGINRKLPHSTGELSLCGEWSEHLRHMMADLCNRLRRVRVCCGDWSRVCGPTPTEKLGLTGVFLDPPYGDVGRDSDLYNEDSLTVAADVRAWAIAHGDGPDYRIALCGYDGEHDMPDGWECVAWKANGGYGSQGDGNNENAHRERVWFSRFCLRPEAARQPTLWDTLEE